MKVALDSWQNCEMTCWSRGFEAVFFLSRTSLRKCALYQTSDPNDKLIARTMPVVPSLVKTMAAPKSTCKETAKSVFEIGGGSVPKYDWLAIFGDAKRAYVIMSTSMLCQNNVWVTFENTPCMGNVLYKPDRLVRGTSWKNRIPEEDPWMLWSRPKHDKTTGLSKALYQRCRQNCCMYRPAFVRMWPCGWRKRCCFVTCLYDSICRVRGYDILYISHKCNQRIQIDQCIVYTCKLLGRLSSQARIPTENATILVLTVLSEGQPLYE